MALDLGRQGLLHDRAAGARRRAGARHPRDAEAQRGVAATTPSRYKIERIVKEHSGAVAVPIEIVEKPGAEPKRLTDGAAIWAKSKSDIKPEDYTEFYRSLVRPVRRAGADRALARRGAARIYRARLRPGLAAVRPVRSRAQGQGQALRPPRADQRRRRPAAGLAALRAPGRRQRRPAAQRLARDDPGERGVHRDPQGRRQSDRAGTDQSSPRASRRNSRRSGSISARSSRKGSTRTPSGATRSTSSRASSRPSIPTAAASSKITSRNCARTRRRSTISPATTPSGSPRARSSKGFAPAASRCCCSPIPSTRSGSRRRPAMTASRSSRSARARPTSSPSRSSRARRRRRRRAPRSRR